MLFSDSLKTRIVMPSEKGLKIDEGTSCGMGSFIYHTKHGDIYGHTGFVPGFNSIFAYFPEKNIAMALQSNCDYAKSKISFAEYLIEIISEL